jgi:AraC family transcriptional regulator of adaptative response/methylated-DNA-[protein]-cysteine methyltransferase
MNMSERFTYTVASSRLGRVLVAYSGTGVCAIMIDDDAESMLGELTGRFPRVNIVEDETALADVAAGVVRAIENPASRFEAAIDVRGTPFQKRVWGALRRIPAGRTASYADIARRLGVPGAARAVGAACAANPLAVVVPCHRVVGSGGDLCGYYWGLARKKALLKAEGAMPD